MNYPAWKRTETIDAQFSPLLLDLLNHLRTNPNDANWFKEALAKQKLVYDQKVLAELQGYQLTIDDATAKLWTTLWDKWVTWCSRRELSLAKEKPQLSKLGGGNLGLELHVCGAPDVAKHLPVPPPYIRHHYEDGRLTVSHKYGYPVVWMGELCRLTLTKVQGVSASWAIEGSPWSPKIGLELAVKGLETEASCMLVNNFVEETCGAYSTSISWKDPVTSSYRLVMDSACAAEQVLYKTIPHLGKHISLTYSFLLWETGKPCLTLRLPTKTRTYSIEERELRRFESDLGTILIHFCDSEARAKYGRPDFSFYHRASAAQESEDLSQVEPVRALQAAIDAEDQSLLEFTSSRLTQMLENDKISSKVFLNDLPQSLADRLEVDLLRTLACTNGPPPSLDWEGLLALFGSWLTGQATVGIYPPQASDALSFVPLLDVVVGREGRLLLFSKAGSPAQIFADACREVFGAWNVSKCVSTLSDPYELGAQATLLVAFGRDETAEAILRGMKVGSLVLAVGIPVADVNGFKALSLPCIKAGHFLYKVM